MDCPRRMPVREYMFQEQLLALQWLYRVSRGNRFWLYLSMALSIASGAVGLIPAWMIYSISLPLLSGVPIPEPIMSFALVTLAAILGHYILAFLATILAHMVAFRLYKKLRKDIISHMGRLSLGYFTNKSSGAIRKIMGQDIENLEIYIGHHIPDMTRALAVPVTAFLILAFHDLRFAVCVLLPLACAGVAMLAMYKSQMGRMQEYFENVDIMNSAVIEYIKGMPIVKIFNITMKSYDRLKSAIQKQVEISESWTRSGVPFHVLFRIGLDSALIFLMPYAIYLYTAGELNLQTWLLAMILGMAMIRPIEQIYTSSSLLASLVEGIRRVDDLLNEKPLTMAEEPETPEHFDIEFSNVSFSYNTDEALKNISMKLEDGKIYALVGESGSGKSTAAQLLLRFWDVNAGSIRIGGKDIRDISYEILMTLVSFVFQDTFILESTVAENIGLGRPDASRDEIIHAAQLAQADGFIQRLEHGYDTVIGSGGVHLSGGEKQRLSVARALLKDSNILVLDEATSSNDPENQLDISKAVKALAGQKTVLLITHHLSSAIWADRIFVFSHGQLAGSGSHEDLLANNHEYQRLWKNAASYSGWSLGTGGEIQCSN